MENDNESHRFIVLPMAVIFDPSTRKILIAKRKETSEIKEFEWYFPGTRANHNEDLDKTLKNAIKEKTGYTVKNLGAIFANTYPKNPDMMLTYFFCECIEGEEKAGGNIEELKWVTPDELEEIFKVELHPKLKEYIFSLK